MSPQQRTEQLVNNWISDPPKNWSVMPLHEKVDFVLREEETEKRKWWGRYDELQQAVQRFTYAKGCHHTELAAMAMMNTSEQLHNQAMEEI